VMQAGNYTMQRSLTYFIKNWYVTRQTMQNITMDIVWHWPKSSEIFPPSQKHRH